MREPTHEVLEMFGVQMIAPLGGRINRHWLVLRRGEQFVLRLWVKSRLDIDYELLTPVWWAGLIDSACRRMAAGTQDDGWTIQSLLRRSPLMGPDAPEFR